MKTYVFSIGEKTTDLCCELMQEYGFDVVLYKDKTSLWEKLKRFYTEALETEEEWFIRIDADIIPNKNIHKLIDFVKEDEWINWGCAWGFDWYKQDIGAISIHVMSRAIIETCLENIESAKDKVRPETHLWRLEDVNIYTGVGDDDNLCCGVHGYGQSDQRERIKALKKSRDQEYNWQLVEKIEALA